QEPLPRIAVEPARVPQEISGVREVGFLLRFQYAQKIIRLGERELRMYERQQGHHRFRLVPRQWMHFLVAAQQRVDLFLVQWIARSVVYLQPLHAVPLDRGGDVMECVGAIRKTHVDDIRDLRFGRRSTPKKIRRMKIVVRPQGLKHRQEFAQAVVKRKKSLPRLHQPIPFGEIALKRGALLSVTRELGPWVIARKNLKAC